MPDYHIPKPNSYEGVSLLKFWIDYVKEPTTNE
jgi:hypothetical protein